MHDGSEELGKVSLMHESVVGAVNVLITEQFNSIAAPQILASLLKMTEISSTNFMTWIWGSSIKFLSRQNSFGENPFDEIVNGLHNRFVEQIVKMSTGFENNSQDTQVLACTGKLVQLYLVLLKILSKNQKSLTIVQVREGAAKIYPFVNDDTKSKLTLIISSLPATAVTQSITNAFSSPALAYVGLNQESYLKVLSDSAGGDLSASLILEQLPSYFAGLSKSDAKVYYGQLVRMFISCKAPALKSLLSDCLVKFTLASTDSFSHLFSKSLAEQIGVTCYFPFSSKPGSEIHLNSLIPSILALWRRLLECQDSLITMIIDACTNLFREGVFPSVHLSEVLDLLKLSLKIPCASASVIKLIRHILPHGSFKVALELLDLYKTLDHSESCAFESWKLIAVLSTTKFPDTLHRRLSDTVIPYVAKVCQGQMSWPMKHTMLASLEVYARYSTCLDIFEHPFLAQHQGELLQFYQRQFSEQLSPKFDALQLDSMRLEYEMCQLSGKDHIVEQLKQLQSALSASQNPSKYLHRIEELVYLCKSTQ